MADEQKVELFELTINTSQAIKDTKALTVALKEQEKITDELKESQGELSEEYLESAAEAKVLKKELKQQETITQNVVKANKANSGSIESMRSKLSVVSVQWAKLSKEERLNTEKGKALTKQKAELTAALKKEEKATGDTRRNVGNYAEGMGGAFSQTQQLIPGLAGAAGGFQKMGLAVNVALGPIGLIVAIIALVVASFKAFFASSEEGQNKLLEFQSIVGVVVGNITDLFAELGEALLSPKKALDNLQAFFERTLLGVVNGYFEKFTAQGVKTFQKIALAWQEFKGRFTDNTIAINKAKEDLIKTDKKIEAANIKIQESLQNTVDAYNSVKDAATAQFENNKKEIDESIRLTKLKLVTDRLEREQLVEKARIEKDIAALRFKAKKEDEFTSKERLKFLKKAGELQDSLVAKDEKIAKNRLELRVIENSFSKSTKENLDEQARLEAEVFRVQTARLNAARAIEREINTVRKQAVTEQSRLEKAAADQAIELLEFEVAKRKELEDVEKERKALEKDAEYEANKERMFAKLDLERQRLEAQHQAEIAHANKVGADTTNIEAKFAKAREALNKAETDAKLVLAGGFAQNLATIFGEGTAVGKAAAVAQTTISTYQAAMGAYASLAPIPIVGPALGIVAAGAAVASGIKQVQNILKVKSGLPGEKSVSGGSISSGGMSSTSTPSTNTTVNEGIASRNVTDTISRNELKVQPTLVVDDVTAGQDQSVASRETATI